SLGQGGFAGAEVTVEEDDGAGTEEPTERGAEFAGLVGAGSDEGEQGHGQSWRGKGKTAARAPGGVRAAGRRAPEGRRRGLRLRAESRRMGMSWSWPKKRRVKTVPLAS